LSKFISLRRRLRRKIQNN